VSRLPKITIVTICKNAGATIERTLASVSQCAYPRLQYIVVDGGSSDDTSRHIDKYRTRIDKYICEPDRGISDALNKAVSLSDGDYHLVVHADDTLLPNALDRIADEGGFTGAGVICGSVMVVGNKGIVRKFQPRPTDLFVKMSIPHMGSLIRKDVWEAAGRYDTRRKIAMDHLLMLRILRKMGTTAFCVVDATIANYSLGGVSDRNVEVGFKEVRDNLVEEGVSKVRANAAYLNLLMKSRISRMLGKR
jgi:glycosyltransferase